MFSRSGVLHDGFTNVGFRWKEKIVREARNARRRQIASAFGQIEACYAKARERLAGEMKMDRAVLLDGADPLRQYAGHGVGGANLYGKDIFPERSRGFVGAAGDDGAAVSPEELMERFARIDAEMLDLQKDYMKLRWFEQRKFSWKAHERTFAYKMNAELEAGTE
eukprot:g1349.t1